MTISYALLRETIKEVFIRAVTQVPDDIRYSLKQALKRESNEQARNILEVILDNVQTAKETGTVICQDTGVPLFYLRTGLGMEVEGDIRQAFSDVVADLTVNRPLRSMMVHPVTREGCGNNTGPGIPIVNVELIPETDYLEITCFPKGAGSGFWSFFKVFQPQEGMEAVKKYILECVLKAGSNPCPPTIVGVGLGGTFDECAKLATKATMRPLYQRHAESEIAELEQDLLEAINMSQIGPMGLSGDTTALMVNVEYAFTHSPWLPVAVVQNCWPGRQCTARIYQDGRVEWFQHREEE
ncbi:fumarate hydratase [Metabacillus arenae]|uniref:Fumarate hydratase n=1 Tax=Metabacillus arenae TaxID=2771434 RepID=A0A926NQZ1_9BACI|nr:fumarate hydratase [Metabacillus arenae]MBD1382311.1 fumarate hydratase [Metabacillus arenae]